MIQPVEHRHLPRAAHDTSDEFFVLTRLYGTAGETLYYADTSAKPGVVYTYRVIPVHAELLNNGILLEGVQAVQVARAGRIPARAACRTRCATSLPAEGKMKRAPCRA